MASRYDYEGRVWFVSRSASGYVTCGFPDAQGAENSANAIDTLVKRQKPVPSATLAVCRPTVELPDDCRILQPALNDGVDFYIVEDDFKALWPVPYKTFSSAIEAIIHARLRSPPVKR